MNKEQKITKDFDPDCLFCKIAKGLIPSEMVWEDDEFYAFKDISPAAPVHFLVIPRKHIPSMLDSDDADAELIGRMMLLGRSLAKDQGLDDKGCRFVLNSREDGGQTVFHMHLHVLGGRPMEWPPG